MNITYDYYKIFYYVAKYQSFTRAASVLMNNQPNLTRSIHNLEHALGCRLFYRTNRGVRLTPEGRLLYSHVSVAVNQLITGEEELEKHKNLQAGVITIGVSETALHIFLLEKLRIFRTLYPDIRIRLSNHSTPQAVTALKNGLVDFAVVTTPSGITKPLEELSLKSFREILVGGPGFSFLADKSWHLADLIEYPFVCHDHSTKSYEFYDTFFQKLNLHLRPDMEAATTDQILLMIKNDLGIGFLPKDFVYHSLEQNEVFQIFLKEQLPDRSVCLIRDTHRPSSIAASKMISFLSEQNET